MKKFILLIATLASFFAVTGCDNDSNDSNVTPPATPPTETGTPDPAPVPAPNPQPNQPLPPGKWGTDGLLMTVKTTHVEIEFKCAVGKINGKITPDENGTFTKAGTVRYFSNETGEHETVPALFSGVVSGDRNLIALRITFDDPRTEGEPPSTDYVLRRNFVGEQQFCAFDSQP